MTTWLPDLSTGTGPLYQRLADRIEADIDRGVLGAGVKLPPQRDLAYDIGATVGTAAAPTNCCASEDWSAARSAAAPMC